MITRMNREHASAAGSAAELARQWISRSERFLEAADHLPALPAMTLPRRELLTRAIECRLKAYLCASRGGAPETRDLARLSLLAGHGGLPFTDRERETLAALDPTGHGISDDLPDITSIRAFCGTIDAHLSADG